MGYLEIVAAPHHRPQALAEMTGLPTRIESADGEVLFQSEDWGFDARESLLPVDYVLQDAQGRVVLRAMVMKDLQHMYIQTWTASVPPLLGISLLTLSGGLLAAFWLLRRILFVCPSRA